MREQRGSLQLLLLMVVVLSSLAPAQQSGPSLYGEMRWRSIGPYRGGRSRACAGVPSQPGVLYMAAVDGGVWRTENFGRTWTPLFDQQPSGSIGSLAVALSNPNIIYAGSGEGLHRPDLSWGDGIYKSSDRGQTWTHLGLRDGQQIPQIAVDPRNPDRLLVAVLGHPYGPNPERGIYRSLDGGQTFQRVLYKDENTGGSDVQMDPANPNTVYAAMWEAREGPWENGAWSGNNGGLFKSTDGGTTWRQLTKGLPQDFVQANIAIAPSNSKRLYISLASGRGTLSIYRSDDAGENWTKITDDPRPAARIGGGDLPVLRVDPKKPDVVYSASVVLWKSSDGGKTWSGLRGAPGGDDYQNIWINPDNPKIILVPGDQGTIVTVDGGETWSSWFNQPTSQMYHVGVDNAFPYRVCSGQQESGSACVSSRGDDGEITFRDWHPVGAEEYGYVTPDPQDPDLVYGGKITRYDRRTGQVQNISPRPLRGPDMRMVRTEPVIFSPDGRTLYFASNVLWRTRDGGMNWEKISPDLTRPTWAVPASVGNYSGDPTAKPTQRGVIYTVAPSPLDANVIWIGTDDGLIQVTSDGGAHWQNVTPPQLGPWWKVSLMDAGHFDKGTAYAAINTIRLDDPRPHIYRTRDFGKTWTEISSGIPPNENTNAVREDTKKAGVLFASTERAVYVSFDDGEHWQPLRLNMPATSVRDILIKDDDLIAATHGRGFWILDDITPLRQMARASEAAAILFQPQVATRVRWDMNTDTPIPPDYAAGQNPPDGAIIDYYLKAAASGPVTLEVLDQAGNIGRRYSSADKVEPVDPMLAIPKYWVRPERALPAGAGMHRWLWDMHYGPLPGSRRNYPMQAIYRNTPPAPTSPWVMPGEYRVRLTVNGQTYTQPLTVRMDPRVKTPAPALEQQFTLARQMYDGAAALAPAVEQLRSVRAQAQKLQAGAQGTVKDALAVFQQKLEALGGRGEGQRFAPGGGAGPETLPSVQGSMIQIMAGLEQADVAPTTAMAEAARQRAADGQAMLARWQQFASQDVPAINTQLKQAGLPEINPALPPPAEPVQAR